MRERGQGNSQVQVGSATDGTRFSPVCRVAGEKADPANHRCKVAAYWELGIDGPVWTGDR